MKQLESLDPGRQWRYEYRGKEYSIIDLQKIPHFGGEMWDSSGVDELLKRTYPVYKYEVADCSSDTIEILGRFKTIQDAKAEIVRQA